MTWWKREHKHYWVALEKHAVANKNGGNAGAIILERCYRCGGVRTIEYGPEKAPIVREAEYRKEQ